jgi:hypothetical protein
MFMRLTSLIAVLSLSILACGRSDDDNTNPDANGSGSGNGSSVTIQQVQSDDMAPGTAVALANVVVTAIDEFGAKTGDIWVEEMGGGKRSGVHVFKAANADVMMLTVGDVINLKGAIKSEFALTGSNADTSGRTVTELEPASGGAIVITKTGQTATITPDKVDALAIGQMYDSTMSATGGGTAFSNAWEDWEGVLIELDNVAAAGAPKGFGTTPFAADAYSFGITGVAKAEGTMTDLTMSNIARATCFSAMTGVVDYFYDYLVLPRSSADFATGGTSCPAAEDASTSGTLCTDGIDNDANGFTDCSDLGCEAGAGAWLGATCANTDTTCGCSTNYATGAGVGGAVAGFATTSGPVYLHDLYVTGVNGSTSGGGYWIADSLTAATGHGAFVFTKTAPDASIVVGSKLATVQGIAGPFTSTTGTVTSVFEIGTPTAGAVSTGGTLVPLVVADIGTLSGATTGLPYTGVLVKTGPVTVGAIGANNQVPLTSGAKSLTMDDDAFFKYGSSGATATPPAPGCYTITGVMTVNTIDHIRTILPRSAADWVTTTGC